MTHRRFAQLGPWLVALWLAALATAARTPAADAPTAGPTADGTLVVVNQLESTVSLIDLKEGKLRKTVAVGPGPHEAAVSPDGKTVAVSNYGPPVGKHGNTLTLIALPAGTVRGTVTLGEYTAPHGVEWIDNERLVCTSETKQALVVVNAARGEVERTLATGQAGSHMVALSADRKRAYSANIGSGTVSAFDLAAGKKLADVPADKGSEGIGLSPDGRWLWTGNRDTHTVSVIDAENLRHVVNLPSKGFPFRVAFTPDGRTAVVPHPAAGEVVLFDAAAKKERKRVSVREGPVKFETAGPPPGPLGVAVHPAGRYAYCTVYHAAAVAVIDLEKGEVAGRLPAGKGADGVAYSAVAVAADQSAKPPADAKADAEKFQGTWAAVSIVRDGQTVVPEDELKNLRLVIAGDSRTLTVGDEVRSRATFKLDPSQTPKAIDVTVSEGPLKGRTLRGVYEIDGDTHRICLPLDGEERPKALASKEGSGHLLQVFRRAAAGGR